MQHQCTQEVTSGREVSTYLYVTPIVTVFVAFPEILCLADILILDPNSSFRSCLASTKQLPHRDQ